MPTVNVYLQPSVEVPESFAANLQAFVAELLSGKEIALDEDEVSVRIIPLASQSRTLGNLELDVVAHRFDERVRVVDELARRLTEFIAVEVPGSKPRAWVQLVDLGHDV